LGNLEAITGKEKFSRDGKKEKKKKKKKKEKKKELTLRLTPRYFATSGITRYGTRSPGNINRCSTPAGA